MKLAKICEYVSKKFKINISVAPQHTDIQLIANKVKVGVFAQHMDSIEPGAFTGYVSALAIKEAGAIGTLINHSERKVSLDEVKKCVDIAKKYGLITVCCSANLKETEEIAKLNPDFIGYEPPELIGTGIPVSLTKPEVVKKTVDIVKEINPNIKVLCGAGISKGEDVKKAIELGTVGVILASGVVKAEEPKKVLIEFAKAIKQI